MLAPASIWKYSRVGWSMYLGESPLVASPNGRTTMQLQLLTKWTNSDSSGCPSVYLTDDPDVLVIQGNTLDGDTRAKLIN